ncbi:MAG: hypothetical protein IKA76_04510 [Clostridia bacterium]|nr:hypothetical protein [Clostridia bacterium]
MSRVSRAFRWSGRIIKFLFFCVVFGVILLLLWRMFSSSDPESMERLTPNDALAIAYEQKGDDLYLFRQEQRSVTSGENNYGYFSVTDAVFIPDANQIQVVVRYNNSTLRSLAEDKGLPAVPDRSEELFDVTLTVATDLTPENQSDNYGNDETAVAFARVHATSVTSDTKNLYNYRRFVFDLGTAELSLSELMDKGLLLAVYTDIYYKGDVNYEEPAYGTLCVFDYVTKIEWDRIGGDDKDVLRDYMERK